MPHSEEGISIVVFPLKNEENFSPADETADSDKENSAAAWIESAQENLSTKEEPVKAFSGEKLCKHGQPFNASNGILRQNCFICGAQKSGD